VKDLREVTGFRGEKILELCLTDYKEFAGPLFRPGFLDDKWPSIDFYVELQAVTKRKPYFFAQAKTTASRLSRSLRIPKSARKNRSGGAGAIFCAQLRRGVAVRQY